MPDTVPVQHGVGRFRKPATWPDPNQPATGYIDVNKVDVIYANINGASNFNILRMGTNEHIHHALLQVAKHMARGIYRIISLSVTEYSCVVVMSTEKPRSELIWKNRFPWDRDDDPQPNVVLK